MAGDAAKVNDAVRSRWAASGRGGGLGLQPILGNASVMVRHMLASEAGKVEVGNVGDVGNEVEGASVGDEVICVPAMRLSLRR